MGYYRIFGLNIASEVDLVEAISIEKPQSIDVKISYGEMPQYIMEKFQASYRTSILGQEYSWVYAIDVGHFLVVGGEEIIVKIDNNKDMKHVRAIILGYALGAIMFQKDLLCIHGSAVLMNGKVVLVSGHSGAGKSTITSELIQQGYHVLSDDLTAIRIKDQKVIAFPAYPQQKLCRDTALSMGYDITKLERLEEEREKYAVELGEQFVNKPMEVSTLVVIEKYNGEELTSEIIQDSRKVQLIIDCLYTLDQYEVVGMNPAVFQQVIAVIGKINLIYIKRPAQKDTVKDIVTLIKNSTGSSLELSGGEAVCQQCME